MDILETLGLRKGAGSAVDEPATDTGAGAGAPDLSRLAAKARTRGSRAAKSDEAARINDALAASQAESQRAQLFEGEQWEALGCMYFDARLAVTGFSGFELSPAQRTMMGVTLAPAMKMLLQIDPGYIALIVFGANFGSIIAQKESAYYAHLKATAKPTP